MSTVALAQGQQRHEMIRAALDRLPDPPDVARAHRIIVKPNVVSTVRPLAATHVEALRAVLGWLRDHGATRVTIAEGSATEATFAGFAAYGYFDLATMPGLRVDFLDLNQDDVVPVTIYDRQLVPQMIGLARTVVESDLRISVTRPKTHDAVIVTGSLKNMLMGSPVNRRAGGARWQAHLTTRLAGMIPPRFRSIQGLETIRPGLSRRLYPSDKAAVHQGPAVINLNLCLLAQIVRPHLGVLDGLIGMHGSGPIFGQPIHLHWAGASTDSVALDTVMTHLMGLDPAAVGYLHHCQEAGIGSADLKDIKVIGPSMARLQRFCQPPATYAEQRAWADPVVEQLLRRHLADPAA